MISSGSLSTHRLNIVLFASTILLGLVYLFVVNSLGTKGYEIRKLELQVRELEDAHKIIQLQVSDFQSINRVSANMEKLNFVPVSNATYLNASDFALK